MTHPPTHPRCLQWSVLDTTSGYLNRTDFTFVDDPFCDGICMYYYNLGAQLEVG